jgi:hypothetical protein
MMGKFMRTWERSQVQGIPREWDRGRSDKFFYIKERCGISTVKSFFKLIRWILKNQIQMSAKMNSS